MFMSAKELNAVLRVLASLDTVTILEINIEDIIISFHKWKLLEDGNYFLLLRKYSSENLPIETRVRQFYSFMETIIPMVSFGHFNRMLKAAGQYKLANIIIAELGGASQSCPLKRRIPHAELINEYFANLKRCADNNWFQDGTRYQLEKMISSLTQKLKNCGAGSDPEQFQILVDKRVMTYFLLAQQFSDMDERLKVMKRMRDSIPIDADRTVFNVIFHSYLSVICALKDDATTAKGHEQQARFASHLCLPDIAGVILRLCIQYKNNVLFFKRHNRDDLEHASTDFEEIFQMFDSMSKDPELYGTIAKLEMVHTLLGIDWDLNVCDIVRIRSRDIERGKKIISALKEPCETRREMLLCLCRARLFENADPLKAQEYAREALTLADDGSYYDIEKTNIRIYIENLEMKILPAAPVCSLAHQ